MYNKLNTIIIKIFETIKKCTVKYIHKYNKILDKSEKKLNEISAKSAYLRIMRVHKPYPYIFIVTPIWWSLIIGSTNLVQLFFYIPIFTVGAIIMRSAGCIINDIIDKNIDAKIERTKNRPLANGELNLSQVLILLAILLAIACVLLLFLPLSAIKIALIGAIGMLLYPMSKYITYFPQIILGFIFNIGILVAWYATNTEITIIPLLIYFSAAMWTIAYDTIYAYQDYEEDKMLNIKSLPILLKDKGDDFIMNLYKVATLGIWLAGFQSRLNILFTLTMAFASYVLYIGINGINIKNKKECEKQFKDNAYFAIIITIAIILGKI